MRRWPVLAVGTAAAALTVSVAAPPAVAQAKSPPLHVVKTLSSKYVLPLQFAVTGPLVFVADSFTSTLNLIGRAKPLATGPGDGGDIAAVALDPHSLSLGYSSSNADHSITRFTVVSPLRRPVVANLARFERTSNPDGRVTYGVDHPSRCVTDALTAAQIPVRYQGAVDSHPYAATAIGGGAWAVADAGGNDIVRISRTGHVSTLSVLPRQALHVTAEFAAQSGLPPCTVGITYYFEAVPTDVEVGPGGWLYVSTLPGGEGVAGSVYKINPRSGHASLLATGFGAATNVAVDPHGGVYVAALGAGTISKVEHGHARVVANLPNVVAIEWANGHLYAATAPAANEVDDGPSGPSAPTGPPPAGKIVILGH